MRRPISVAFALFAAILVATAPPVAAANTAVASINATDSDFSAAADTDDVVIINSGTAASVELPTGQDGQSLTVDNPKSGDTGGFEHGWQINPNTNMSGVTISVDPNAEDGGTAYLRDEGGNLITSTSVGSDDTATLRADLRAGTNYWVTVDGSGNNNDLQYNQNAPETGRHMDATAGVQHVSNTWGTDSSELYMFDSVTPLVGDESDGYYLGDSHDVDDATQGFVDLTLENATASVTWQQSTDGGSTWTDVASSTYTSSGNKTDTFSGDGLWRVNVTFTAESGDTTAILHDEGVEFENNDPVFDQSTLNPADGSTLTKSDVTLTLGVEDQDFATSQGDEVTATFKVKEPGETSFKDEGTDTLTSNGTAQLDFNAIDGGTYEWKVAATDDYGGSSTSSTFTFTTPANITFRNESNASQIITGANVTVTFYNEDGTTIVTKEDTDDDGNISLNGLPTGEEMVLEVQADGWHRRTVYLESIFEQGDVYLLNKTAFSDPPVITFDYEDRTGQFPGSESTVRVQRAVDKNSNNSSVWRTVAADFVNSAGEFTWRGETDVRYRVVVENGQDDQRILQHYTPLADATEPLIIGQISWDAAEGQARFFDAQLDSDAEEIDFRYQDPTDNTTEVRVRVVELHNESNEIYDQNFTGGPYGNLTGVVALTTNQSEESWVVKFDAETDGDGPISGQTTVGSATTPLPVDGWLLGTFGLVFVTFVGSLYGPRTTTLGAWAMLLVAGAFMGFGWVDINAAGFVAAAGLAVGATVYNEATT